MAILSLSSCSDRPFHRNLASDHFASEGDDSFRRVVDGKEAELPIGSSDNKFFADPSSRDLLGTLYLSQNWSSEDRQIFYRIPQGSHIMPMKFALALKSSETGMDFFSNQQLARYGFIPQKADSTNPYGLPVGFTIDGDVSFTATTLITGKSTPRGERMLGVNCSLCHTSQIKINHQPIRIDGGHSLSDFQKFVKDMDHSLKATREDPVKLQSFLQRVKAIDQTGNSADDGHLIQQFDETMASRGNWTNLNDSSHYYGIGANETPFVYGPGRIDAFSQIFNQALAVDLAIPENAAEPDAPVNSSVVWDGPQQDWVQWNGLASNTKEGGPIGRNVGEVLGVFGHVDLKSKSELLNGYCSSARRRGLEMLEALIGKLVSPKWPEQLSPLDFAKVQRGRAVFESRCIQCHQDIDRTDANRKIITHLVPMSEVGTDSKYNIKAMNRVAKTGVIESRFTRLLMGRKMEKTEPAWTVLSQIVAGAVVGSFSVERCSQNIDISPSDGLSNWKSILTGSKKKHVQADDSPDPNLRRAALVAKISQFKARPLNGIWSSAPYFHNGSVKNLYDLFLRPNERPTSFYVGCGEYDAVNVGVSCSEGGQSVRFDETLDGNRPMGHDYGPYSDAERMDLIEYLKSI